MSDSSPTDYGAELAGGVFELASQFINQKIVEIIRKNFSNDGKRQRGDFYMDQSRELFQEHSQIIELDDKHNILRMFRSVRDVRIKMDNANISGIQRFLNSVDYKRLSKRTYKIVVKASNRGLNNNFMDQITDDIGETVDPQAQSAPNNLQSTQTAASDSFAGSHEAGSVLDEVDTSGVKQMDVETYESEATGDTAVLFGLHRQNSSTEHLLAASSSSSFSYNSTVTVDTCMGVPIVSTSSGPW